MRNMLKAKKMWFTLAEVVIACSIFAIVVVWIILAINRSFIFMNNTKLSVRAANLAREWVEMMYNIRDTNWRIHSGERDKYWLNLWDRTLWNEGNSFIKWFYVLKEWNQNGNSYFYADSLSIQDSNINDFYSDEWFWKDQIAEYVSARDKARLEFDWHYSYYELNEETWEQEEKEWDVQDALVWEWLEFYRIVRVFGVYKKNVDGTSTECLGDCFTNWTPAEMRFCVKVFYRWNWKHSSEICGMMTNFME